MNVEVFEVCTAALVGLGMVLRFLERRDAAKTVALSESTSDALATKLKAAEDRISKLEMKAAFH